jgi:hypothetical protein
VDTPPLAPVTRSSVIVTPAVIALSAIQDALERAAPRELSGKPDLPPPPGVSNAEIGWSIARGPFAVSGRSDGVSFSTALHGSLRASGQMSGRPSGFPDLPGGFRPPPGFPGIPGGIFGGREGRSGTQTQAERAIDQRAEIAGNVQLTARPTLLPGWRVDPNLVSQVTISDAFVSLMGMKMNLSNEIKPVLERTVNDQIAALQTRVANDPVLEQTARREWAKLCRSIPLGDTAGVQNLWLEIRPTRALAAQPRVDETALTLTIGVQADTRIVPGETKPDCPFPATLELVPQMQQGRVSIDMPIDVPFPEVSRLIEAQIKGKTFPEDKSGGVTATVRSVDVMASGERLLISMGVTANETKSWFGLSGDATIYIWGRPVLDRERQKLRFDKISVDVESEAAFGVLGMAARIAAPNLQKMLEAAIIDLSPLATNARKNVEAAISDFRKNVDGLRVEAAVVDVRLADVEFDSKTLRLIAEADGTVRVVVTALP